LREIFREFQIPYPYKKEKQGGTQQTRSGTRHDPRAKDHMGKKRATFSSIQSKKDEKKKSLGGGTPRKKPRERKRKSDERE